MERAKQLMEMVAKYESLIYDTADYIWKNPETGYREWKTSAYMEEHFEALGYTLTKAGNIPGFYAVGTCGAELWPDYYSICMPGAANAYNVHSGCRAVKHAE